MGGYGFCAAHSRWYWGLKLYLLSAPDGMPITWRLADPKIGEREVCLDLLAIAAGTGLLAPGTTILADKNLAGREIETQVAALGVHLLRPDSRGEPARHGSLGGFRQWIESVCDSLKRPARPGTPRRPHPARRIHPHRPAAARPGRLHLAQLGHRSSGQEQPHCLRSLAITFKESII
jgi:hypothetical protein